VTSRPQPVDVARRRRDFPILDRELRDGTQVIYLDNAATSQTPARVIETINDYYRRYNANVHRGIHQLSEEASLAYEEAHDRLAAFVGASGGREEMIFTKNATESINLVAYAWGLHELEEGDEVVLTEMEHHAMLVTWQQIARRTGAEVRYIRIDDDAQLDMDHARTVIGDATAIVCATHASNVLGTVTPLADLATLAHDHGAVILADGVQAVPHRPVDVEALDVDFYAFTGHKMCGPTGIGCLYGKRSILREMEPFLYGGDMIRRVTFDDATWNDLPWKYEAGTPLIAEGIALAEAADYLDDVGLTAIQRHEQQLSEYALDQLAAAPDVETYGPPQGNDRVGLVAFNLDGVHPHDLASILNEHGIAIRAGDHCTQPLHNRLDIAASARASFHLYNSRSEIHALIDALDDARNLFS
jgi:cysteine desulfurase/selenocysteine lyase